jgi:hypothetical protein
MKPPVLVLLVGLSIATPAFAQTAEIGHDLTTISGRRAVVVVDDSGHRTHGQVLRFTPDALTLLVGGTEISVERTKVASVYTRGDSIWNGMAFGALSGGALGLVGLATSENPGDIEQAAVPVLAIMGIGIGAAVDAAIRKKHVIYERGGNFASLAAGRMVIVVDDRGEAKGRVLSLTPEQVTVMVNGRARAFATPRIDRIFVSGDSLKNGAMIGFISGAVIGAAAGTQTTCGDFWTGIRPCSGNEKARQAVAAGAVFGGLAAALGAGIDAMIPGRTLVYQRQHPASGLVTSLIPAIAPSGAGLTMRLSW